MTSHINTHTVTSTLDIWNTASSCYSNSRAWSLERTN